jgi:hypothetical protein
MCDFFQLSSVAFTDRIRTEPGKSRKTCCKFSVNQYGTKLYYGVPTAEFQIAAASNAFKGWLSARTDTAHGLGGNDLLS